MSATKGFRQAMKLGHAWDNTNKGKLEEYCKQRDDVAAKLDAFYAIHSIASSVKSLECKCSRIDAGESSVYSKQDLAGIAKFYAFCLPELGVPISHVTVKRLLKFANKYTDKPFNLKEL